MPGYIKKLLTRLAHPTPKRPVHAPHSWTVPVYGWHIQQSIQPDNFAYLPANEITKIQLIIGALLYYTGAVDPPMYPALNKVSLTQSKPMEATLKNVYAYSTTWRCT